MPTPASIPSSRLPDAFARRERTLPLLRRLALLLALVPTLGPARAEAQANDTDVELWLSAGLRIRPHRRVYVDVEQGVRFEDNITRVGRVLPEVNVGVKLVDDFRLVLGYRLTWVNDANPDLRHRLQGDARVEGELGSVVEWVYRQRYQATIREGRQTEHTLRSLFGLAFDTDTPVSPFIETELFADVARGDGVSLAGWRGTAGLKFERRWHDLELFYRLDVPIPQPRGPAREMVHILGLGYRATVKTYD